MKRAAREKSGSVVFDKRRKNWRHLRWKNGKRLSKTIGTLEQYPTREQAIRAVEEGDRGLASLPTNNGTILVNQLVQNYREERMPTRVDTRRSYDVWLNNYILPTWGDSSITELRARPIELWLRTLRLSPKSKVHIRGIISVLWAFAMWREDVPGQANPMKLVRIERASKRTKQPRSLTVGEFQRFAGNLDEPFRTFAFLSVCFGLRISECLGLKWADVDWLGSMLRIERSVVAQNVDETKTEESRKELPMDPRLTTMLQTWRQESEFSSADDWVFASPIQIGRRPWSYDQLWRVYQKAASKAGLGRVGTHSLRHTYRSWLDSVGTSLAVQQKLMRHADLGTTSKYGNVEGERMRKAQARVAKLAVSGPFGSQRIARAAN